MSKRITIDPKEQLERLKFGAVQLLPEDDFLKKLEHSFETDTPLRVKFGADPSRPDIHLGHSVVLQKLKLFQELGHEVHFIIGDFTAMIGDPTGKSQTRPILTKEEVLKNAKTYEEQVLKILSPDRMTIHFNSAWLDKITPPEMIQLLAKVTLSSLIEREDFHKRFEAEEAIYMHELVYPIMQGYDSVAMEADIELGGTDQTFNLLMGRHLQKAYAKKTQCVLTMPILEGTDGVQKMSKSLDNYISLDDSSSDMFGKMMSISDDLMKRYYQLLVRKTPAEIGKIIETLDDGKLHPMDAKKQLAAEIVDYYYPQGTGQKEREAFEARFSKNKIPDDIKTIEVPAGELALLPLLTEVEFIKTNSEGRRLMKQNALKIDGKAYKEEKFNLDSGQEFILKLGKLRMMKVIGK